MQLMYLLSITAAEHAIDLAAAYQGKYLEAIPLAERMA